MPNVLCVAYQHHMQQGSTKYASESSNNKVRHDTLDDTLVSFCPSLLAQADAYSFGIFALEGFHMLKREYWEGIALVSQNRVPVKKQKLPENMDAWPMWWGCAGL